MHTLTARTKFTFGDRVRFDYLTSTGRRSGIGKVVAIEVWEVTLGGPPITYALDVDGEDDGEFGVPEGNLTLADPGT
jgi:hypothetical protein